ncbi:substrate-binding periplasmic protein [Massilia sp. TS11]|uniref:substrate-binding periplasmic protein n=1 Tax=Massilia sp. TS11 TaxID=2908003 RepID=UPI0035A2AB1D
MGILATGLLAAILAAGPAAADPRLRITTEHSPPAAMMANGQLVGFATDKVREILRRTGTAYEIVLLPWKRAYLMAQNEPNTCVYSTTRTPEREALFKWVGPTHDNDWTLFALSERHYKFKTLADVGQLRIGTYNGDVRGDALQAQGFNVDAVQSQSSNPRKLLLGRIDLWATSLRVGNATVVLNGWQSKIEPVLTWRHTQMYLACHRSVPDSLVARMNSALEAMKQDGTAHAIDKKYELWQDPLATASR